MIKRLAGCIRQYKRDTVLTPLFMLGEVSCECVIPLLTAELINNIQAGCSMNVILQFGLKLFLVAMLSLACGSASGWFCASAAAGFAQNLRRDLYYKVQDFSFSNIDRFSTSSLVTRLTTDVSNVQQAFMMMIRMAVRAPMMLIFATVMSIQVGKQLAFIFAGIIPVLGFCLYLMAKTAMPLFKAVFKKYDRLNNSVQENVQAMRVVKSFVREDYETEKFTAESDDVRGDFLRAEKILALNNPLMHLGLPHPDQLLRGKAHCPVRRYVSECRRADEHDHLLHADSDGADDALDGLRHDYHGVGFGKAYLRGARRGKRPP